ncbi:CRISPR-associated endonuclease Csn1 [Natronobacillus azotifigens]|uniref:type II CRISPR RNA-guided endonuclease Cas9 n=1 Tax=Natronobacillus azotifigens TaxID=472978 RepID=UPI003D23C7B4
MDIGVSSVGWGIINEDSGEIIDAGVRLFEESTRNANEDRRGFRGARRLKRRRSHRLERAYQLFNTYNLPVSGIGKIDPYKARYEAINGSVSLEELVAAFYHLIKKRGTVLDSTEDDKTVGNELSTKEQLKKNNKLLKEKYICEIQLERIGNSEEKMRNHQNRFRTADYVKEAKAILQKQKQVYSILTEEFSQQLIDLMETRREYYEGPGSKKSPTPYGPYSIDKSGKLIETTMINKMRGKCTYFPDELRIAKMSFTADLYNLLSGDLNKLQIDGAYLTSEDKKYLIENLIKKGKNITLLQILKYKGANENAIVTGYRRDMKTDKPTFTEFKGYKELKKIVDKNNLPINILEKIDLLDGVVEILTAEKSLTRREEQLRSLFSDYEDDMKIRLVSAFKENNAFVGYHALSKKAISSILDDLMHTNKNQMELFAERGFEQKRLEKLKGQDKIVFDEDAILSTVAKRAHREAVKIVNSIREKYGELEAIVVETAREKNSDEKRKQYNDFQRKIGKHEKEMAKLLGVKKLAELHLNGKQHLALKLWESQDGKCIYSGKSILINDIVNDRSSFEIDHILPVSLSFDDSQQNKVLCRHSENQNKGQLTPFQYFHSGKASRSFEQFKVEVLNLYKSKKISSKKKDYLLELRDIAYNDELQREFINRNLVDTQYAMRSFSMTLRTFFKSQNINTRVLSIRGSFTAALRRRAKMNKDRDDSYAHHAIDALIVAAIGRMPVFEFFNEFRMDEQGVVVNKDTGEILEEKEFFSNNFIVFLRNIMKYEAEIKYSHKVDRKVNRSMSNQTIYGTREKDGDRYYLGRTANIYQLDKKGIKSVLKRLEKEPTKFLIAKHNPELLTLIKKIVKEHADADNPFKAFYDAHGYILKDGKVPVKRLKYYDQRLGVHMSITEKYPNAKNEVVLLSVKSVRVDVYRNQEGRYKYLGVPYHWFRKKDGEYFLDMKKYNEEKEKSYKKIDDSYTFQLSLYKNDRFSYEKNGEVFERVFRGDNNPRQNKIEVDFVNRKKQEQKEGFLAPSTIQRIYKYNVDVLGNTYKIEKEKFKNTLHQ